MTKKSMSSRLAGDEVTVQDSDTLDVSLMQSSSRIAKATADKSEFEETLKEEDDSTGLSLRSGKSMTGIQHLAMKKEYVQLGSISAAYRNRECPTPTNTVNSGSARRDYCLRRQDKMRIVTKNV
ncbi:hypothetical protein J7T55_013819 [Diaporthe amygdali]|uniref:uncharacterized protein n=1 Tax=Phomopsis amygdali TaxID=1214568 RepID=UPI0022FEB880|nr:uncharacterized protein J7T55_013819 [Diaporthe amygdali]KAJ0119616.1 hypothetical protein J7T55_013819 [Diaporthe amygdali]